MRALLAFLLACAACVADGVAMADDSIFPARKRVRTVQQSSASAANAPEVSTEDQLRAAIGAAAVNGRSDGKVIVLAAGLIPLSAPLVFGTEQIGLTIIGQGTTLFAAGVGPVISDNGLGPQGVTFENVTFQVELQNGVNACVSGSGLVGPIYEFIHCKFSGASFSVRSTTQSTISLLLCTDNTANGSFIQNNNGRYIGGRHNISAGITISGGAGSGNVISGNAMNNGTINTAASGGFNTITGNTRVNAASAFAGTDLNNGNNT